LLDGITPDGYRVNGSGEWDKGSSIYDRDDSSDDNIHKAYIPEEGGSETPGESEPVSGENPWDNKTPIILTQSGIVSVLGVPYAVVSFSDQADGQEKFHYSIAGKDATSSVTPVNTSGRVVKIPLSDENTHTLTITSGKWTVTTVSLKKPGSSIIAEKEIAEADFDIPNDIPYLVLANETIPLTQYIKFIRLGNSIFIKPGKTTADSVPNQSLATSKTHTK